jgi:hypothetical protein
MYRLGCSALGGPGFPVPPKHASRPTAEGVRASQSFGGGNVRSVLRCTARLVRPDEQRLGWRGE